MPIDAKGFWQTHWPIHLPNIQVQFAVHLVHIELGTLLKKKWDFLGIFPKGGGGVFSIPKTFGIFTKLKMALKTP